VADCPANNALIGQGRYDVNGDVPQRDPDKQGPPVGEVVSLGAWSSTRGTAEPPNAVLGVLDESKTEGSATCSDSGTSTSKTTRRGRDDPTTRSPSACRTA